MHYENYKLLHMKKTWQSLKRSPVEAKYYEASAYPSEQASPNIEFTYIIPIFQGVICLPFSPPLALVTIFYTDINLF